MSFGNSFWSESDYNSKLPWAGYLRDLCFSLVAPELGFQMKLRFEQFCFALEARNIQPRALGRRDEEYCLPTFNANIDACDSLFMLGFEPLGDAQQRA